MDQSDCSLIMISLSDVNQVESIARGRWMVPLIAAVLVSGCQQQSIVLCVQLVSSSRTLQVYVICHASTVCTCMKVHVHSTLANRKKRKVIHTNTYLAFLNPYLAFHTNKHGQIDIQTNMDKQREHLDVDAMQL